MRNKNDFTTLEDCFNKNPVFSPKGYAVAHKSRLQALLNNDNLSPSIKRQILAVIDCLENENISVVTGLDRLMYFIDKNDREKK